jgi:hypothetical protein
MGDKGNQLLNNLVTQVNSKGVPVQVGETVNLNLKLGGSIKCTNSKNRSEARSQQILPTR